MVNQTEINVKDLLLFLKQANVKLWVEEGVLRSRAPEGAITPFIRNQIRAHKANIIKLIQLTEVEVEKTTLAPIPKVKLQKDYPLSNAQRRLWVLDQMEENQLAYNMPVAIQLNGNLDAKALERAIQLVFERHESLRTNFVEGRQVIRQSDFHLEMQDYREVDQQIIQQTIQDHARFAFDLSSSSLLQIVLLKLSSTEHILLFNMHHIISDGWSMTILTRELSKLYDACKNGDKTPISLLPPLSIQYKDFVAWQNELLASEAINPVRQFWLKNLTPDQTGQLPVLNLPTDYPRPLLKTFNGDSVNYVFELKTLKTLKQLTQSQGATLFMTLTALVNILLHRYSGQTDILMGTPSPGRNHPDLNHQIGFYLNTLVLRNQVQPEASFSDFLEEVKRRTLAAFENELYPFDQLVEELAIPRDTSRSAVFDVWMVLHNHEQAELKLGDLELNLIENTDTVSKFDLAFSFAESEIGLSFNIDYNTDLFKKKTIHRFISHFSTLVQSVLNEPKAAISSLNILPKKERKLLLDTFNDRTTGLPSIKTIFGLFEEQVKKTPNNIALVFEERQLTYQQLNEQANRVGHYLRKTYNIQPDDIIALQLERSEWMIIAILGVLKAGAAYLPIAPNSPSVRTAFMLKDAQAKVLLTDEVTHPIALEQKDILAIEIVEKIRSGWESKFLGSIYGDLFPTLPVDTTKKEYYENLDHISNSENLAYVIYTSGSTGKPKGVMVENGGVVNMVGEQIRVFQISELDKVLQFANYTFDASVSEILMALLSGAALILGKKEYLSVPNNFISLVDKLEITVVTLPPVYLSTLDKQSLKSIRVMITAGEKPILSDVIHYKKELDYYNAFGPTECSVCTSIYKVPNNFNDVSSTLPIGQPIANVSNYVLNSTNQLQPIGIEGELCLSGIGLARGYLNDKELTEEKFIPNPFKKGERLYKTGDLARWLLDGNLQFIGRIDEQLKIRGHRIETKEIELALVDHSDILASKVVVDIKNDGVQDLMAFIICRVNSTLNNSSVPISIELNNYLSQILPEYMIPNHIISLEEFPTTSSGKINVNELLLLNKLEHKSNNKKIEKPRNEKEQLILDIWKEILEKEEICIYDSFFHIGGDSIKVIRMISELSKFDYIVGIKEFFSAKNIANLATILKKENIQKIDDTNKNEELLNPEYFSGNDSICFNPALERTIFAFPGIFGLAIGYKELADYLLDFSIYSFDFLLKENRLDIYYQHLKTHQPEGPYILLGYSGGCSLAFKLALFMEEKGETVSDIIFLDGNLLIRPKEIDWTETWREMEEAFMENEKGNEIIGKQKILKKEKEKMLVYTDFLNENIFKEKIQANIHQIQASEKNLDDHLIDNWEHLTEGNFIIYSAKSTHDELLEPPFLKSNAKIIHSILRLNIFRYGL